MHTALAHESRQIVGRSDQGFVAVAGSSDTIVAIDEPDDPQAVLRMLLDLVGEQMGDAARADDDDVLDVGALPTTDGAARGAQERDERNGEEPEHDETSQVRVRKTEDVRDDEEAPGPEGDDLEDTDHVVDRRVIGSLLVTVVEAVDARKQNPQREGRDEDGHFPHRRDLVGRGGRRRELERDDVGHEQSDHICRKQQPAHEPTTPSARRRPRLVDLVDKTIALRDGDRVLRYSAQPSPPPCWRPPAIALGLLP